MKLSLAWIFDHIDADWRNIEIEKLVDRFNQVTAEIEDFYRVSYDMSTFFAGIKNGDSNVVVIPELGKEVDLGERINTVDLLKEDDFNGMVFLIKKEGDVFRWASLADFGVEKDGLIPALDISEQDIKGYWRNYFEESDVILEVDNKSITHRPDMWGHRGFAREIAAFLGLPFKPKGEFLSGYTVASYEKKSTPTSTNPFSIDIQASDTCYKFNGLYIPSIQNKPSNVFIVSRLVKVGSRPISGIVDLTNYVAFDWSQPVHAYDSEKIVDKTVIVRNARPNEKLILLDGSEIELTSDDMVVADGKKPICLAGIKGGLYGSVTAQTTSLFFEAANFDANSVRCSAQRHKLRTDSSARFEKTLDPNQAIDAILRFIELAGQCGISMMLADEIESIGKDASVPLLRVGHKFLEQRLGQPLDQAVVTNLLKRLEFIVEIDTTSKDPAYLITVPSFRASKDIKIKEDILEEVARMYGFDKIKLELPKIHRTPFDLTKINRSRMIRQYLAYTANMIEQQNFPFYNEKFLQELEIELTSPAHLVNPVSENNYRLVSSLIPGLFSNIADNLVHRDSLNFFEIAKVWHEGSGDKPVQECLKVSGIFFQKRKEIDFYEMKNIINTMIVMLGFDSNRIVWEKTTKPNCPWCKAYQSVIIHYAGRSLGYAGLVKTAFLSKLPVLPESRAFVFELNGDFLMHEPAVEKHFVPFSRYQETYFDLSLMVPLKLTTAEIEKILRQVSPLIVSVELIDFFEKDEWDDVRSLTFRVWVSSKEKTLEKEEIDVVWQQAIGVVQKAGAQVRAQE